MTFCSSCVWAADTGQPASLKWSGGDSSRADEVNQNQSRTVGRSVTRVVQVARDRLLASVSAEQIRRHGPGDEA